MLRERNYVIRQLSIALDVALAIAAFFLAYWLRQTVLTPLLGGRLTVVVNWQGFVWLLVFMPILTVMALQWHGYYGAAQRFRGRAQISRLIALALAEAAALSWLLTSIVRTEGRVSRIQPIAIWAILYVLIELKTVLIQRAMRPKKSSGKPGQTLILVGSGEPLSRFIALLKEHPYWGVNPVGIISDVNTSAQEQERHGLPILGRLSEALGILQARQVDEVVIVPGQAALGDLAPLMRGCEEMGMRTHLSLDVFGHAIARPTLDHIEGMALVTYSPVREMGPALLCKTIFDRIAAAALLVILSPIMLAAFIAIRRTSKPGEPVLFKQIRCGLNGRRFNVWKFRTMRIGAEDEIEQLRASNEADGPVFKMRGDPRVTPAGRVLRRWSIDEIPQLWNVLIGEMSLVGPRPPLPSEVGQYAPWQRRRLSMRPGITCLWQVQGRSLLPFEKWMKLDLHYIDNWSLWLDFKIILRTGYVILTGYGAM